MATIIGLVSRSDLNGKAVEIGKFDSEIQRYTVTTIANKDDDVQEPEMLAVKPKNILFPDGTQIQVQGLINAKEHNGKFATILSYSEESGRYNVQLLNDDEDDDEEVVIRQSINIMPDKFRLLSISSSSQPQQFGNFDSILPAKQPDDGIAPRPSSMMAVNNSMEGTGESNDGNDGNDKDSNRSKRKRNIIIGSVVGVVVVIIIIIIIAVSVGGKNKGDRNASSSGSSSSSSGSSSSGSSSSGSSSSGSSSSGSSSSGSSSSDECRQTTSTQYLSCGTYGCSDSYSGGCRSGERQTKSTQRDCSISSSTSICYYDVTCCSY